MSRGGRSRATRGRAGASPTRAGRLRRRTSSLGRHLGGAVAAEPCGRRLEPVAERRMCTKAEELLGARDIELASRLTVRLRRVPDDLARVARELGDELRELADRDLLARAEIHRVCAVVVPRGEPDALGAVVDVEKLSRGR